MLRTHRPTIAQPEPLTHVGEGGGIGGEGGADGGMGDGGGGDGGHGGEGGDGGEGGGAGGEGGVDLQMHCLYEEHEPGLPPPQT